ncbi:MAG: transcriptional regulator [Pseudomonadota bacterium]
MTEPVPWSLRPQKRVEIIVDAAVLPRLSRRLDGLADTAYTVLPAAAGHSASEGHWSRSGELGAAGRYVVVFCLIEPDALDPLLSVTADLVRTGTASVAVSDVSVVSA